MAVNYTDVQKTEKYISRTNFDALEMAAVPEGTEFNIVDQIHESDLDSDVLQKLNNNAKINTANTFTAAQTFKKDITIEGNIIQNGSAYETHAEKLYTKNDMIYTRDGATAALADNAYTGIQAVKYDGTNDGQLVFGKDGVARVGDVGNTQPLATRAEADALMDGHVLQWDAAGQTLVDSSRTLNEFARVEGDNTFTGANTFTDSIVIQGEAGTVGLNVSDPSNPAILTRVLRNQIFVTDSSNGMKVSLCSAGKLTVQDGSTSAKYQPGKITYNRKDLLFPETEAGGTFALTSDIPTDYLTGGSQTTTSNADGGSNVFTFTKANGTSATFTVKNGSKGSKGDDGSNGIRGSRWSTGTAITGTSTTAAVFSGTGITDALVNDMYLNTSTGYTYRCTVAGAADVAKWVYAGSIKGATGSKGDKGDKGDIGPQGPKGDTPEVITSPFITGQHLLPYGEPLTILENKMYIIQCFDKSDNLAKFTVNGQFKNVDGNFALIISGVSNLAVIQTGSVLINELAKTVLNARTVVPKSSNCRLGYYEVDGTLELFKVDKGDTGATGPTGPAPDLTKYPTLAGTNTFTGNNTFEGNVKVLGNNLYAKTLRVYWENEAQTKRNTLQLVPKNEDEGTEYSQFAIEDIDITTGTKKVLAINHGMIKQLNFTGVTTMSNGTLASSYNLTLPQKEGTLALTSDLPDTSNFVTLSGAQEISGNKTFTGNNNFTGVNTFHSTLTCPRGIATSIIYPGGGYTLTVPKKDGTIAITNDIPIKTATLSDNNTTLTLVLR